MPRRRRMSDAAKATPGWSKTTGEWTHESGARVRRGLRGWIGYLPGGEALTRLTKAYPAATFIPRFSTAREAAAAVLAAAST